MKKKRNRPNREITEEKYKENYIWCSSCNEFKHASIFHKNKSNKPNFGYAAYCKVCWSKKRKTSNYRQKMKLRYRNIKKVFVRKLGGICVRCGYSEYMCCLEFHHVNPQDKLYSTFYNLSMGKALNELDKCTILCSHCHRLFEAGYWTAKFEKLKLGWGLDKKSIKILRKGDGVINESSK